MGATIQIIDALVVEKPVFYNDVKGKKHVDFKIMWTYVDRATGAKEKLFFHCDAQQSIFCDVENIRKYDRIDIEGIFGVNNNDNIPHTVGSSGWWGKKLKIYALDILNLGGSDGP